MEVPVLGPVPVAGTGHDMFASWNGAIQGLVVYAGLMVIVAAWLAFVMWMMRR